MRITKFTHSCLRVTDGDAVLVVDPGAFGAADQLDGAHAVLVTHEHPDHLDAGALTAAARANPGLRVFAPAAVAATLDGVPAEVTAVAPGAEFTAAGLRVRAYGGVHAEIHPDIPRVANLGYLVGPDGAAFYHPGDAFAVPDAAVDTLFVPLAAPWQRLAEAIDFVRAVRPRRAYAIHDALLTEAGAAVYDAHLHRLSGTAYARVAPGTVLDR